MYQDIKERVYQANLDLVEHGLVVFTFGNVSEIDRKAGVVAIKPSGVSYDDMRPDQIVILDLKGHAIDGDLRPSSDTPTHLELYRQFKNIGGITHTHSCHATMWAQACKDIPCFGTTHADHFYGSIPVTDVMTQEDIQDHYELNTGKVIVKRFENLDPKATPAVLVANHGPFTWGQTPAAAVESGIVLEKVAKIAMGTMQINPSVKPIEDHLLEKHYSRKHGCGAYYGQRE